MGRTETEYQRLEAKWSRRPKTDGAIHIVISPAKYKASEKPATCAKCNSPVNPGFCYTGKVLDNYIRIGVDKSKFNPVTMEDENWTERITVPSYIRGFICDDCAGEYRHHVNERTGQSKPIVVVDPIPSARPHDEREGFRSNKALNTRRTQ